MHNKAPIGKTPILETILNGPFWLPMFVGPPNTIAEALAAAPGAVGKPDVAQFNLKGDPTKNMDPKKRKRLLRLEPGEDLFDHFILFPLFQPTRGAGDDKADRLMWKTYFQHRQNNGDTREFTFHKLYADERIIPGFASSTSGGDLDQIPMIQPRPRRSRNT